jgi:hypothetical protein
MPRTKKCRAADAGSKMFKKALIERCLGVELSPPLRVRLRRREARGDEQSLFMYARGTSPGEGSTALLAALPDLLIGREFFGRELRWFGSFAWLGLRAVAAGAPLCAL